MYEKQILEKDSFQSRNPRRDRRPSAFAFSSSCNVIFNHLFDFLHYTINSRCVHIIENAFTAGGCTEKFMQAPQYFRLHFANTYTIIYV